jgi:hypothetical protein
MPRGLRGAIAGSSGGASRRGVDATERRASTTSLEIEMSHDQTFTKGDGVPPGDEGSFASGQAVADVESNDAPHALPLRARVNESAWAWATEHVAPGRAATQQLISWLARGELPAYTLVWRPGWGEWLPALQVAELAAAFPNVTAGNRRVAQSAPTSSNTPPPVPVGHCPRLRLLAKDVVGGSGADQFANVSQGLLPAQSGQRAFRDIDDMQREVVTSQVPAAAMLEAARATKERGPAASGSERWARLELGTFGEASPRVKPATPTTTVSPTFSRAESAATPPGRTLSPHALELDFSELLEPEPSERRSWRSRRYGPWLAFGLLLGSALGLIAAFERSPDVVLAKLTAAQRLLEAVTRGARLDSVKAAGNDDRKRAGESAVLQALTISDEGGSDRVVFEFHERVPSYQLGYVDEPVSDCAESDAETLEGNGWLEVRFFPASAHTESGEPSATENAVRPGLSSIREIRRTCDSDRVVTWVIRTAARQRFHAYELRAPARFVVDIEH